MLNFRKIITKDLSRKIECLIANSGKLLVEHQGDPNWQTITVKEGLKTKADEKMNELICQGLRLLTPDIEIYSEEISHDIKDRPKTYWLIDPIDGTASWLEGFSGYVTQIALIQDNSAVLGIIYHPPTSRLWASGCDGNARLNGKKLYSKDRLLEVPRLIDNYPEPRGLSSRIQKLLKKSTYIECGSLGLKSVLALTDEADIFAKETIFRDWDLAPALAISACLNGSITTLEGKKLTIGKSIEFKEGLLVCGNKREAHKIIKLLDNKKGIRSADR